MKYIAAVLFGLAVAASVDAYRTRIKLHRRVNARLHRICFAIPNQGARHERTSEVRGELRSAGRGWNSGSDLLGAGLQRERGEQSVLPGDAERDDRVLVPEQGRQRAVYQGQGVLRGLHRGGLSEACRKIGRASC